MTVIQLILLMVTLESYTDATAHIADKLAAIHARLALLEEKIFFMTTFQNSSLTVGHGTVLFDKVLENIGNPYNSGNGVFTAPVGGLYVFLFQTFTKGAGNAHWDLHVNGQTKLRTHSITTGSASNMCVYPVILMLGDSASVLNRNPLNIWGTGHSIFGGWLLKPV